MGAIAEAIAAYARPMLDETDGSPEQVQRAFSLAVLCWNLALMPARERDECLAAVRPTLKIDDGQFEEFRRSIILPMILRHYEMFPGMHGQHSADIPDDPEPQLRPTDAVLPADYPETPRNAPCPCGSGKKYKRCCGRYY